MVGIAGARQVYVDRQWRERINPRWASDQQIVTVDLVTAWEVAGTVLEAQAIAP